jgi:hypothetical protein
MTELLDELYLTWLYGQVASVEETDLSQTYWRLAKICYSKEFVWTVPNDDNRAEDGKDLRQEFYGDKKRDQVDQHWMSMGCSMLEMFIALARKADFEYEKTPGAWFWEMMNNCRLSQFADNESFSDEDVEVLLEKIIWRTYRPDGHGGLFPLDAITQDQRRVELWYQMQAYLLERYY